MQKKILFIPGKNPKPEPDAHHELLQQCLLAGIAKHCETTAQEIQQQNAFELCAWNYPFYQEHLQCNDQQQCIERLLNKDKPNIRDKVRAKSWKIRASRLVYQTGDRFPWLIDLLADEHVKAMLDGTTQYFENHQGRGEITRSVLRTSLQPYLNGDYQLLIIAHSLGSIIAYDTLYQISQLDRSAKHIDLFLTLGSPLGLHYSQKRLLAFSQTDPSLLPSNIKQWHNVAARGDLVSVDETLSDDFALMVSAGLTEKIVDHSKGVYHWYKNALGYNFHSSYGYLAGPTTAKIIQQWWKDAL